MVKIIKVDETKDDPFDGRMEEIKSTLNKGGVIAFPTDTFYGLGVDPFLESGVAKVFKIKKRSQQKPLLVLVDSPSRLRTLTRDVPETAQALIDQLWPGPLTLALKALPHIPGRLIAHTGKIAVRQPDNALTRKLMTGLGHLLTAPSANIEGKPPPSVVSDIDPELTDQIDLIVDGGATPGKQESTLLDMTVSPPKMLREGAISKETIESILKTRCAGV